MYSSPGVFNVLDDWGSGPMVPGSVSYTQAVANAAALQATITAAVAYCESPEGQQYGAIVLIPSNDTVPSGTDLGDGGKYYICASSASSAAVTISCQFPILILGTGDGTILHMAHYDGHPSNNKDLFLINNAGSSETVGGVTFQDLHITYDNALDAGSAIHCEGSENVKIFRCIFYNVPAGIVIDDAQQFVMIDCTNVLISGQGGTILSLGVSAAVQQSCVTSCVFRVGSGSGSNSQSGLVIGSVDQLSIVDVRFEAFNTYAIQITPSSSCTDVCFEGVYAAGPGTQLLLQPGGAGEGYIRNASFVNCTFLNNDVSDEVSAAILNAGTENSNIDTVRLLSCTFSGNPSSGLEINSGQNIEILGGAYSSNGQAPEVTAAGIWLNGSSTNIRVCGASLVASIFGMPSQQYGVIVGASANVFITDCDLTGYGSVGPIQFDSPGSNVQVVNCAGYNDQSTPVSSSAPSSSAPFDGVTLGQYYGPIDFYANGGSGTISQIVIHGVNTQLKSGSFSLPAGGTAEAIIDYSGTIDFLAIGH